MSEEIKSASTEIEPKILQVIHAAASMFVIKRIQNEAEGASASREKSWSIKGREIVAASHNVVQRGH